MSHKKKHTEKLDNLLGAIEEQILCATNDELKEDIIAAGEDPDVVSGNVKSMIAAQLKTHRQSELRKAQQGYREAQKKRKVKRNYFLDQPEKARALLKNILDSHGDIPQRLTLAFREGKGMSDDDVQTILQDLDHLGYINEEDIT